MAHYLDEQTPLISILSLTLGLIPLTFPDPAQPELQGVASKSQTPPPVDGQDAGNTNVEGQGLVQQYTPKLHLSIRLSRLKIQSPILAVIRSAFTLGQCPVYLLACSP